MSLNKCIVNRIGFIGAGQMASAIIKGLVENGVQGSNIFAHDISQDTMNKVKSQYGIQTLNNNLDIVRNSDAVIVAVKPKDFQNVLNEIKDTVGNSKPVISIAGGLYLDSLSKWLNPGARIVRAMPNICAAVLESVSAITPGPNATKEDVEGTKSIFDCVGTTMEIKENLIDAFSGVAGCGPAFIFPIIEAMADGGVYQGIPRQTAIELAAQVMVGAGKLVLATKQHPGALKDSVCSPGGSTIAGVRTIEDHGVRSAYMNAVISATEKSLKEAAKH